MGRIGDAFERATSEQRAALVIYLCAGDPDLSTTKELVLAAAKAGADVIELGMPFSDPTADGPSIQRASERSLKGGTTLKGVLDLVREIRKESEVSLLLFGYYNPLLAYGEDKVVKDASAAGVDGFLVVDLPPEESEGLRAPIREAGLDFVPLIAPTSGAERIALAGKSATSFIYYVSMTGVTGAEQSDLTSAAKNAAELQAELEHPVALGFGIKTPEDVARVAPHVSGVVVGSAVVNAIESATNSTDAVNRVETLVHSLRQATSRT